MGKIRSFALRNHPMLMLIDVALTTAVFTYAITTEHRITAVETKLESILSIQGNRNTPRNNYAPYQFTPTNHPAQCEPIQHNGFAHIARE